MNQIRVKALPEEIVGRIREMIRKGILKEGDKIVEKALCEQMGVSRTPLREALRLLSAEGLIQLVPNRGARVAQPSLKDIGEMFQVMSILEGACARQCAEKLTEKGLRKLEELHEKLEKHAKEKDYEKYVLVNHRYHTLVQELAGNKILSEVINGLRQKILLHRYRQILMPNRLEQSMQEHRDLQEAFRTKEPEAAERLMKHHLIRQCETLERATSKVAS